LCLGSINKERFWAKKLLITHLSPRYTNKNSITPSDLLKEAQKVFPNTQLAKDFLTVEIK